MSVVVVVVTACTEAEEDANLVDGCSRYPTTSPATAIRIRIAAMANVRLLSRAPTNSA
jgi:hypothetical protein